MRDLHRSVFPAVYPCFFEVWACCERLATPAVVGLIKPTILIPLSLATQLTPAQVEAVLAHELAHIRRRDPWFLLIQRMVEAVLFFHPAVWWISRRVDWAREACCDELALSCGLEKEEYAEALVRLSEIRSKDEKPGAAVADFQLAADGDGKQSQLTRRILHILGVESGSHVRLSRAGMFAAIGGVLLVGFLPVASSLSTFQIGPADLDADAGQQIEPLAQWTPVAGSPNVFLSSQKDPLGNPYRFTRLDWKEWNKPLFAQLAPELAGVEDKSTHVLRFQPDPQSDRKTSWTALNKEERADEPKDEYRAVRIHVTNFKSVFFQENETTWEQLPELLKQIQDRPELVLELAIESADHVLVSELNEYQTKLGLLANQLGFKFGSYVGEHPMEWKPKVDRLIITIMESGNFLINGESVPQSRLQSRLKEIVDGFSVEKPETFIRIEKHTVPWTWIVGVRQLLGNLGINKVKALTQGNLDLSSEEPPKTSKSDASLDSFKGLSVDQMVENIRQRESKDNRFEALDKVSLLLQEKAVTHAVDLKDDQERFSANAQGYIKKEYGESGILNGLRILKQTGDIPYDREPYLPLARELLSHENSSIRAAAVGVLPQLKADRSDLDEVFALIKKETEPVVKREIAFTLFALDPKAEDPRLNPALIDLLNDPDDAVVKQTIRSMWGHPVSPEVESVLIDLSNTDAWSGDAIYYALSTRPLMRKPVCERLIQALEHPDWNVSGRAAWGLSHHALSEDAVDLVVKALAETYDNSLNRYVRENCLYGLKRNPTPAAVRKLQDIAENDEKESFREEARKALQGIR